jgi:hypothetical protein
LKGRRKTASTGSFKEALKKSIQEPDIATLEKIVRALDSYLEANPEIWNWQRVENAKKKSHN